MVVKRLVKRESIKVQFELPGGSREYDIKAGSNLRGEMIRLDVPVGYPANISALLCRTVCSTACPRVVRYSVDRCLSTFVPSSIY